MKSKLIIMAAVLFCTASCKNSTKTQPDSLDKDIKDIVSKSPGINAGSGTFTIEALEGWSKTDTSVMGLKATFINSPAESPSDHFSENVNVVTEKVGDMSLEKYFDTNVEIMKSRMPGFEMGSTSDKEINGRKFKNMKYSHNYGGNPVDADVYFTVNDGLAYIITCSAQKGKLSEWESRFEKIVNTFSIKN